jgi:selenophosphate synthase
MYLEKDLRVEGDVDENLLYLMFDPQTAGGLLIAVGTNDEAALLAALGEKHAHAAVVGECVESGDVRIVIR